MFLNGDIEKAITYFKLNIETFPNSGIVWNKLGDAYSRKNQCKMAIQCFTRVLELDTTDDKLKKEIDDLKKDCLTTN